MRRLPGVGSAVSIVLVALSLSACSDIDSLRSQELEVDFLARVAQLADNSASMGELIQAEWNQATIIPPYTSNEEAASAIGHTFDRERAPWALNEGGDLIVLTDGSGVIGWIAVPWENAYFACLPASLLPETRLRAASTVDGERVLITADQPDCEDSQLGHIE